MRTVYRPFKHVQITKDIIQNQYCLSTQCLLSRPKEPFIHMLRLQKIASESNGSCHSWHLMVTSTTIQFVNQFVILIRLHVDGTSISNKLRTLLFDPHAFLSMKLSSSDVISSLYEHSNDTHMIKSFEHVIEEKIKSFCQ